jgi:hypothetical protein
MQGSINAQKTMGFYFAMPGNHHMRRNKIVIIYLGMVPDVVAAPKGNIASDFNKRLNGIIIEYETIVAAGILGHVRAFAAYI